MKFVIPSAVCQALKRLSEQDFSVCLVGGCVRALLMGDVPHDFDIATSALPEQVLSLFHPFKTIETGLAHGTVLVVIDHCPIEITTFRVDGLYSDRRRPDQVSFTDSIEADLSRRDFTVNAMAWPIPPAIASACPDRGEAVAFDFSPDQVIDPYGGRTDIANRLIRCVGEADRRFSEDALRILRALRFAATLGFAIESETADAIHNHAPFLRQIARERILTELQQLLCGAFTEPVLSRFFDVVSVLIPEMQQSAGPSQQETDSRQRQTIATIARLPADFALRLAALLLGTDWPASPAACSANKEQTGCAISGLNIRAADALARLRTDQSTTRRVTDILRIQADWPEPAETAVKRWLRRVTPATALDGLTLKRERLLAGGGCCRSELNRIEQLESLIRKILAEKQCYRLRDLAVNGADLLRLGLAPGRPVGLVLDHLLDQVIDGRCPNDKGKLLRAAAEAISRFQAVKPMISDDGKLEETLPGP